MKKLIIALVAIVFVTNAFSQEENFQKSTVILLKDKQDSTFSESIVIREQNEIKSVPSLRFKDVKTQFDKAQFELKLNDYKIKSLNCSAQDISSQELMGNLIIDEFANYLTKKIVKTTFKIH